MSDGSPDRTPGRSPDASPAVLHVNDCASVGATLVAEAARQGLRWDYLPPERVRPVAVSTNPWAARAQYLPYVARRALHLRRAQVVHVHYATSARLLRERGMPTRPYVLHLHGSDIREQWQRPAYHDEIQQAVDDAARVYYANLDTAEAAAAACPDAEYLPSPIDLGRLPARAGPDPARPARIVFVSRWDDVKGADANLELVRELAAALPDAEMLGIDWGPKAGAAAAAGVRLVPRLGHSAYLDLVASATVAVGQARPILALSEFEAMAIGVPTAAIGTRLPRPDDGSTPPVIEGDLDAVVGGIRQAVADPSGTAAALGGSEWARTRHDPAPLVPRLLRAYRAALAERPGR